LGHRVKIHKITPVTGKERDDLEVKDWSSKNPKNRLTTFLLLVL
jgi:hypothetical protein